jgi:YebC/PmpR family DNA-binding regulatory protein
MSGHSKWKTIQHKKGAADAKRGKVFSKLAKELAVAAREGGSDPEKNAGLRAIMQKAKAANMPSDNIERAVKKGAGELEGSQYDEIVYEGFAAGGVGLVVMCLTDNKNRSGSEVRHIFTKQGSGFAAQGAVSRNFVRKGQIFVGEDGGVDEDTLMGIVLDAGAEDMRKDGDEFEILTEPAAFGAVMEALEKAGVKTESGEISLIPLSTVPISDKSTAASVLKFIGELEDHDDVQSVYSNMDIDDAVLEELGDA